jgi:hypothetical protein
MNTLHVRPADQPAPEPALAQETGDALGITPTLEDRLLLDTRGQRFEPMQMTPQRTMIQTATLLLRRDPVGGMEPVIQANQAQIQAQMPDQLNRALGRADITPRILLQHLEATLRERTTSLVARAQQLDQAYTKTQERLQTWQTHAAKGTGGLGRSLARMLIGGDAHLSLPEVIVIWNQREHQAMQRAAAAGAQAVASTCLDLVTDLLTHMDDRLAEARRLDRLLRQRELTLRQAPTGAPAWTTRIDPGVVTAALLPQIDLEPLSAELVRRLAAPAALTTLTDHVEALARQSGEQHLAAHGLGDLLQLDAQAVTPDKASDALVLVGQAHLAAVQRPTWHLVRRARPRVETLQITPDGTPVFHLDGLGSAAYGDDQDRLGFLQVHLGVALDDLALLEAHDAAFQAALAERNLYVLDDLAQAARPDAAPADAPEAPLISAAPLLANGRDVPA